MTQGTDSDRDDRPKNTKRKSRFVLLLLVFFLVGLLLGWLIIQLSSDSDPVAEENYYGSVVDPRLLVNDFTLTAHSGERVSLSDFAEKVVLLYFGYTYCPDVCPASLAQLAKATNALTGEEKDEVQVMMITVDPKRDTKELLAEYIGYFDPSFLGLTGSETEISTVADAYGVYFEKQESGSETEYLVNHTASVFAIDKDGYLRLLYPFGTPGENIASDLRQLVSER